MSRLVSQAETHAVTCTFRQRKKSLCALDREEYCAHIKKFKKFNPDYDFCFATCVNETCFIKFLKRGD